MGSTEALDSCFDSQIPIDEKTKPGFTETKEFSADKESSPTAVITTGTGGRLIPSRYICVLLGFLSCVALTVQRLNLSMAIVAMVNHTANAQGIGGNVTQDDCPVAIMMNSSVHSHHKAGGSLEWDSETQNHIMSASFFGFVLTQTPGGRLSETIGAKQILIFSLIVASLCNIFSPLASDWGAYVLMGMQFVKGLSQGLTQPALTCLMARWYPKPEKGFLSSLTFAGYPGGAIVGGLMIGAFCDSDFLGGWPLVFYVFGFLGLVLSVLVFYFTFNNPDEDPGISEAEYKYILSNMDVNDSKQKFKTPWKPIVSSIPTWALFFGMFGQYWMTFYFLSVHPTYLGAVLHFTHIESGYLNSLPFIGQFVTTSAASYLSDVLVNKEYASVDTVRKVCNSLSCIGFSLGLLGVTYAGCDRMLNIVFFVVAISCVGFGYPGSNIVALDMTINYAGTLMGIISTFASTSGFIIPLVVGALTSTEQTLAQWAKVCYISAGVGFGSGLVFAVFGSAKVQKWDSLDLDTKNIEGLVNEAFESIPEEIPNGKVEDSKGNSNLAYVIVEKL